MREYNIIIEGEHISYDRRGLTFGELQRNNRSFDFYWDDRGVIKNGVDYGKWFRLSTVTMTVVGYDENEDAKPIATIIKDGKIVDGGFCQVPATEPFNAWPSMLRICRTSCTAWGEIEDDDFNIADLKVHVGDRIWDNGETVESIVQIDYKGESIVLADVRDPKEFLDCVQYGKSMSGYCDSDSPLRFHSADELVDIVEKCTSPDFTHRERVEIRNKNGDKHELYVLGYEPGWVQGGAKICIKAEEKPVNYEYKCVRLVEWKILPTFGISRVHEIEETPYVYNINKGTVTNISEEERISLLERSITVSDTDKRKVMVEVAIGDVSREDCARVVRELDVTRSIERSGVTDEVLTKIWASETIPATWKYDTLSRLVNKCYRGNVLTIPLEFQYNGLRIESQGPRDENDPAIQMAAKVVRLLYENDFAALELLDKSGQLDVISGMWQEIALRLMLYGDYDPYGCCGTHGTCYMDKSVVWLENYKPELLFEACDRFGNNIAMYVYAGMMESMNVMQDDWAYDEAAIVINFLKKGGCDASKKNVFGVSAAELLGLNEEDDGKGFNYEASQGVAERTGRP